MTGSGGGLRTVILLRGGFPRAFGRGVCLSRGIIRSGSAAEGVYDAGVGGLFQQVLVPDAGGAVFAAGAGNPGVLDRSVSKDLWSVVRGRNYLVAESPNGNTNAAFNLHTSTNGVSVVASLRFQFGRGRWQSHMDVQLCKGNLHVQRSESFHVASLSLEARSGATNAKMRLKANTIDLDPLHFERLDKIPGSV